MLAVTSCFPAACPGSPGGEPINVCKRRMGGGCNLYLGLFILQDSCQQTVGEDGNLIRLVTFHFSSSPLSLCSAPSLTPPLQSPFVSRPTLRPLPPLQMPKFIIWSVCPSCCFSLSPIFSLFLPPPCLTNVLLPPPLVPQISATCVRITSSLHLHPSVASSTGA